MFHPGCGPSVFLYMYVTFNLTFRCGGTNQKKFLQSTSSNMLSVICMSIPWRYKNFKVDENKIPLTLYMVFFDRVNNHYSEDM